MISSTDGPVEFEVSIGEWSVNKVKTSLNILKLSKAPSAWLRLRNLKTMVSLWKRIKYFPSELRWIRNSKDTAITSYFGFVFEKNSVREIAWLSCRHRVWKAPFSKCFPSTQKRRAGVFNFLRPEERLREAPFSWRLSVDSTLNRRNKAAFLICYNPVWTAA